MAGPADDLSTAQVRPVDSIDSISSMGDDRAFKSARSTVKQEAYRQSAMSGTYNVERAVNWVTIIITPVALILAVLAFLGHHFFYSSLSDTKVNIGDVWQQWAIRVGNVFAIVFQTSVGVIIGAAATQMAWAIVRRKYLRISAIDGMFGLAGSPISLFNRDLIIHGWPVVILAALFWSLPLITVFTAPTLSVSLRNVTRIETVQVPLLNATLVASERLWMRTEQQGGRVIDAGLELNRRFQGVSGSGTPLKINLPHLTMSYKTNMTGPAIKCQTLEEATADNSAFPAWNNTAVTAEFQRGIAERGIEIAHDSYFGYQSNFDIDAFKLRSGNKTSNLTNTIFVWTDFSKTAGANDTRLVCRLFNATYSFNIDQVNGTQTVTTTAFAYDKFQPLDARGLAYSQLVAGQSQGFTGGGTFTPVDNKTIGAYYSTFKLFTTFLSGRLSPGFSATERTFGLYSSPLMDCQEMWGGLMRLEGGNFAGRSCPDGAATLGEAIQELSKKWAISMLAFPEMANTTRITMGEAVASVTEQENYWKYSMPVLLGVYGGGLLVALLCVVLGLLGLRANGWVSAGSTFSAFLLASRNPDLDALAKKRPEEFAGTKVRYGLVRGRGGGSHRGFEVKKEDEA